MRIFFLILYALTFSPLEAATVAKLEPALVAQKPAGSLVVAPGLLPADRGAPKLVEPVLRLPASPAGKARIALTFDACAGATDPRIMDALIAHNIPATIFVTGRWLARNADAFARMRARPDLFEIEDHGARHLPAVDYPTLIYGLKSAGSPAAVRAEVSDGAAAITAAGGTAPHWFRGATAKYDASALAEIHALGYETAGYSRSGDGGASFSRRKTARQIETAQDGDVILSHINQPTRPAGAGVVDGMIELQKHGVIFVRLKDVPGLTVPPT